MKNKKEKMRKKKKADLTVSVAVGPVGERTLDAERRRQGQHCLHLVKNIP